MPGRECAYTNGDWGSGVGGGRLGPLATHAPLRPSSQIVRPCSALPHSQLSRNFQLHQFTAAPATLHANTHPNTSALLWICGSIDGRTPNASSVGSCHRSEASSMRLVREALVTSVTCRPPPCTQEYQDSSQQYSPSIRSNFKHHWRQPAHYYLRPPSHGISMASFHSKPSGISHLCAPGQLVHEPAVHRAKHGTVVLRRCRHLWAPGEQPPELVS